MMTSKQWKTTSKKMEGSLKKWKTTSKKKKKKMEENLKKMEDDPKHNLKKNTLIGCDIIVN
jgi:hypothetical protein